MARDSNEKEIDFSQCAFSPDRKNLSEFLTSYLRGKKESGYVLNVNGDWGSGKTFFSKAWKNSLKRTHPAIYIDAWKTDFSNDPIIVVVKQIIDELNSFNKESGVNSNFESNVLKALYKLTSSSAKIAASGAAAFLGLGAATGKDSAELMLSKLDKFVEGVGKIDYENYKLTYDAMDEFKSAISSFLKSHLSSTPKEGPLFIFIDELDRCRPTYAVEMLEAVKHLFGIDNIVFVITTNTTELKHSISAVYGANFSSERYLERFFDRSISLPTPSIKNYIEKHYSGWISHIDDISKFSLPYGVKANDCITALLLAEEYQLRDIDKFMDILIGAIRWAQHHSGDNEIIEVINLITLIVYKNKQPNNYNKIISTNNNELKVSDVQDEELKEYRISKTYPDLFKLSIRFQKEYEGHISSIKKGTHVPEDISRVYQTYINQNSGDSLKYKIANMYIKRIEDFEKVDLMSIRDLSNIVDMAVRLE